MVRGPFRPAEGCSCPPVRNQRWMTSAVAGSEVVQAYRANALFDAHQDDAEFGYQLLADEARDVGEATARSRRRWPEPALAHRHHRASGHHGGQTLSLRGQGRVLEQDRRLLDRLTDEVESARQRAEQRRRDAR